MPVGVNTLASVVTRLCSAAGFKGFFTNHSLRATSATRMFDADVDEQLIMAKTGHASSAVRCYKRINDEKLHDLTNVVAGKCIKRDVVSSPAENGSCGTRAQAVKESTVGISSDGVNITLNININRN